MAIANSTLDNLAKEGGNLITNSEGTLNTALANLGADTTASELVQIQAELAKNSMIAATVSGIIKERGDCLKGVAQKVG